MQSVKELDRRGSGYVHTFVARLLEGVKEETRARVHPLKERAANGDLSVQVINGNHRLTNSKIENGYGCRHSLNDGTMRTTVVTIGVRPV